MITQEQILENFKTYTDALEKTGFDYNSFYDNLPESFAFAPSNLNNKYYGCFQGGLIEHSLRVGRYAHRINNLLPEEFRVDKNSLTKVTLLHLVGLSTMITDNENEWKKKNLGDIYAFIDNKIAFTVAERTASLIMKSGAKLTDEEFQAIIYSGKPDTDKIGEYMLDTLGVVLKMGMKLAIEEEKQILKK